MTDVNKKRIIREDEVGVRKCEVGDMSYFSFSQDEEYLLLGYMSSPKDNEVNDVIIIRIGSFSDFFAGKPIKVEGVLHLIQLDMKFIMGVHMNREREISVIGRIYAD